MPDVEVSVSATTRRHRPGEIDGVHYHFLPPDAFDALIAEDGLLEWADFSGRRYGTPVEPVRKALAAGRTVVLEIDVQGARQVRERMPDAVLVFLSPPDVETLGRRLAQRGTEDPDAMVERLRRAREEIAESHWFDHVVVNDEVDAAADAIARILRS